MKHFIKETAAILYSSSHDKNGLDIIKETLQFPNYYHKGKKQLLENKCKYAYFIPANETGLEYGYFGEIESVARIKDYESLNPLWLVDIEQKDREWDMVIKMKKVMKVSLSDMEKKGFIREGIQGGIRYKSL